MIISDATSIYYGEDQIYKVYLGESLVWGLNYITSQNNLTSGGYAVGSAVDKTTGTGNYTTSSSYLPGTTDFTANRKYWPDWGDDIFDGWGFFYIYDYSSSSYLAINMSDMEEADGVISQDQFILNGRTFTVNYGYPVQGIFKIDISVDDRDANFAFGMDGNLGSNGSTVNSNLAKDYTLDGESFKLHYNYNYQGTRLSEKFYTYFVPYEKDNNKTSRPFNRYLYNVDYLSIHSTPIKKGLTVYIAKHQEVSDWIINDLQLEII